MNSLQRTDFYVYVFLAAWLILVILLANAERIPKFNSALFFVMRPKIVARLGDTLARLTVSALVATFALMYVSFFYGIALMMHMHLRLGDDAIFLGWIEGVISASVGISIGTRLEGNRK